MKMKATARKGLALLTALVLVTFLVAGCGGTTATSPSTAASASASAKPSTAPSPSAPAVASAAPSASAASASAAASAPAAALKTVDFTDFMKAFDQGKNKSVTMDRTNIITADTTTTATIAAPYGEKTPVVMLKGNAGTLEATSKTSGKLATDPAKNSYIASAVVLKDGTPAQYGDGIYKFKLASEGPAAGQWNNAVVFKDSAPQKPLSDPSVTKALAIAVVGGVVQIQRNYTDNGKVVTQDVVKDTGVSVAGGLYHYFILAMQDVASGTNIKLWIDGKVAYSGVVTGVTGTGAIQLQNNSTPLLNADKTPQITDGAKAGTFQPVTACMESYIGGYDDGPAVSDIALDPVK